MADVHTKEKRSYNMSRIRSKDTKPELLVRKHLFASGFRYRLHDKKLPGKPDIILPKYNTIILIHGCFWHSHQNCRYAVMPKSNVDYWSDKISKNLNRDTQTIKQLTNLGWKLILVWECELKRQKIDKTLTQIITRLNE
jgi:DNA mismatch endonuclease (patch repair protein)